MRRAILGALLLSFGTASAAGADPIRLTSGGILIYDDGSDTSIQGSGSGFSATGSGFGGGFAVGFNPGDTVPISEELSFRPTFGTPGSVTSGGITEDGYLAGTFQMNATPIVVGNATVPTGGYQTFTTPFTLSGQLWLFTRSGDGFSPPVLTQVVTASGTASFEARNLGSGLPVQFLTPDTGTLDLTFSDDSPPVTPEPSTMLLLGAGIIVAVWQSRRLRHP